MQSVEWVVKIQSPTIVERLERLSLLVLCEAELGFGLLTAQPPKLLFIVTSCVIDNKLIINNMSCIVKPLIY